MWKIADMDKLTHACRVFNAGSVPFHRELRMKGGSGPLSMATKAGGEESVP